MKTKDNDQIYVDCSCGNRIFILQNIEKGKLEQKKESLVFFQSIVELDRIGKADKIMEFVDKTIKQLSQQINSHPDIEPKGNIKPSGSDNKEIEGGELFGLCKSYGYHIIGCSCSAEIGGVKG